MRRCDARVTECGDIAVATSRLVSSEAVEVGGEPKVSEAGRNRHAGVTCVIKSASAVPQISDRKRSEGAPEIKRGGDDADKAKEAEIMAILKSARPKCCVVA